MAGIISLLCFTIMAGEFIGIIATDYCNLKSCKQQRVVHTMCKFTSPKPAAACRQYSSLGLNDAERKAIVKKHNELRQKVASGKETRGKNGPQPPAVSMPDLTWDDELETIAQRWANQCIDDHDDCCDVERFSVGQNIASTSSSGENNSSLEKMIQAWYDEVRNFDKKLISSYADDEDGYMIGHYTQIVWAKTTQIGCGRIKFKGADDWTNHMFICNYGPAGNFEGQKMYEIKK